MTDASPAFRVAAKVFDREALARRCEQWRAAGRRIAFANGCFDCIHGGHVSYLEDSARQGDVLVVGVNDDESVRRLKGEGRPVYPLVDREILLGSMECVDAVVAFPEDTCAPLMEALRPDVHCKGTDYTADTVPERDTADRLGIAVYIAGPPKENASRRIIARGATREQNR
jgi:rfaE bifunctional protein nucleotidyltransferase chain/domain